MYIGRRNNDDSLMESSKLDASDNLTATVSLNNSGIELEKEGKVEDAIKVYEENVKGGYPALHSYKRLMILYRRQKMYSDEIRIILRAIEVFSVENERRAKMSIKANPNKKEEIMSALTRCDRVMGDNGFYVFVPYEVNDFQKRLEKVKKLMSK